MERLSKSEDKCRDTSEEVVLFDNVVEDAQLSERIVEAIDYRQYQVDAWSALHSARLDGADRALLHMATGLGKTTVAAGDVEAFIQESEKMGKMNPKVLFLANQRQLVHQAAERFKEFFPDRHINEVLKKQPIDHEADMTFATLQRMRDGKYEFNTTHFDYVIVDESHHSMAPHFSKTIDYFKPQFRLGITATPFRSDEKDLQELFGDTVYSKSLASALAEGWLTMPDYRMQVDEILEDVLNMKFASLKSLNEALFVERRNEEIADIITETSKELANPKTLVFAKDIEHAESMSALIPGSEVLHSRLPTEAQDSLTHQFKSGELKTIVTIDMFNEGVDVPEANMLVFLRSTSSRIVFEQQLGRGLRKAANKDKVIVLDFVGNSEKLLNMYELINDIKSSYIKDRVGGKPSEQLVEEAEKFVESLGFEFTSQNIDILLKLQEIINLHEVAPDDWIFIGDLAESLGMDKLAIQNAGVALSVESSMMMRKNGYVGRHYSPNDAALIVERIQSIMPAPEDWVTTVDLARSTNRDVSVVRTAAKNLGIGRIMRTQAGREGLVFSPAEEAQITEYIRIYNEDNNGWRNINELDEILPISRPTISSMIKEMGIESTQLKANGGRLTAHYPPNTVEILMNEFNKIPYAPEGYVAGANIAKEMGVNARRFAAAVEELSIEGARYRSSIGKPAVFYSPEEAEAIKRQIEASLPAPRAPEGYVSVNELSSQSATAKKMIARMAELGIQGSMMRGQRGKPSLFLSPEDIRKLEG